MANKKLSQLSVRTPSLTDLMLIADPSTGYSYKATVTAVASIIETDIGDAFVTLTTSQTISGAKTFSNTLTLSSVTNASTDTDKFVVLDGGVVKYRTGTQVLSDIGGIATSSISGTSGKIAKFTGSNTLGDSLITESGSVISINYSGQDDAFYVNASTYYAYLGDANGFANGTNIVVDDATGMVYSNSYSYQRFDIGYSEKMRLTSTGLGIGTSSPLTKFNVSADNNDANSGQIVISGSTSTAKRLSLGYNTTSNYGFISVYTALSGYNNLALQPNGGNVGIGTTSPAYKLTTVGSANNDWIASVYNTSTTNPGGLQVRVGATSTSQALGVYTDGIGYTFNVLGNGNVGIGTTSPSGRLQVSSATAGDDQIWLQSTSYTGGYSKLGYNANTGEFRITQFDGGVGMTFYTGTTPSERMRISSGGLVGIATSSPTARLDVISDGNANGITIRARSGNDYGFLNFRSYDGNEILSEIYVNRTASNTANLIFTTNNGGSATERMRITSGGNVGIGTTSPAAALDVLVSGGGAIRVGDSGNKIQMYADNSQSAISNTGSVPLRFLTNGSEFMRITSGGNVGIGTTSPSAKFVVSNGGAEGIEFGYSSGLGGNYFQSFNRSTSVSVDIIYYLGSDAGNANHKFYTSGSERMRISSAGDVLVGGTTSPYNGSNRGNLTINGGLSSILGFAVGGNAKAYLYHEGTNMYIHNEVSTGIIYVTASTNGVYLNTGATSWTANSDLRLKNIIKPIDNALDKVMQLNPIVYSWKSDSTNKENLGLIAQEVETVLPGLVDIQNDELKTKGVRYTDLIPILIKSIKELKSELETLKK